MAIFKRGKFYHIILEMGRGADGKRLQKSIATEFIRKTDAENYEADLKRDIRQGSYSEPSKKTCNEFFEEWFIDRKNDIKLSSWQNYEWLWRTRVQPVIGHMLLASIRPVDIMLIYRTARGETKEKMPVIAAAKDSKATKRYPGAKLKTVLAQNTISKIHRFLHKAMGDAVRIYDIMPQNPMHRMVPPKKAHYEPVIYDVDMLKKLFSLLEGTLIEVPIQIIAKTGMRSSEAYSLKWSDIKGTSVRIADAKTSAGNRVVELPETVILFLKEHKKKQNERRLELGKLWQNNDLIWCRPNGTPYGIHYLLDALGKITMKNKLPTIRVHDLRHAYVTHMLATGASPADLAAQVGHASVSFMVKAYAHAIPTRREALAKLTDDIMSDKPEAIETAVEVKKA